MKNYFSKEDDKLKWTEGQPETLLKTVVCTVTSRHNISSDGTEGDYIIMNAPDWVIVVAEHNNHFLMVKQWRHGEGALSVEFPGGVIDAGEEPETAARRELEEETGYSLFPVYVLLYFFQIPFADGPCCARKMRSNQFVKIFVRQNNASVFV